MNLSYLTDKSLRSAYSKKLLDELNLFSGTVLLLFLRFFKGKGTTLLKEFIAIFYMLLCHILISISSECHFSFQILFVLFEVQKTFF